MARVEMVPLAGTITSKIVRQLPTGHVVVALTVVHNGGSVEFVEPYSDDLLGVPEGVPVAMNLERTRRLLGGTTDSVVEILDWSTGQLLYRDPRWRPQR